MLQDSGYQAVGVDPEAPEGPSYQRAEFEHSDLPQQIDAAVACTSLHHVADPGPALDTIAGRLAPHGAIIVIEWDWESFDEPTARWCFERLGPPGPDDWLHRLRDEWAASGQDWDQYIRTWATQEGLHTGQVMLRELDQRFDRQACNYGPYFFSDLAGTSETDEQTAIDAHQIRPTRIHYVGQRRVAH